MWSDSKDKHSIQGYLLRWFDGFVCQIFYSENSDCFRTIGHDNIMCCKAQQKSTFIISLDVVHGES